jgi:hypothetical protein
MDKSILMYETTLRPDARCRLKEIGWADVVIGIPSHRNGRTISEPLRTIGKAVGDYLPAQRVVLMSADGGSSDNTSRCVTEAAVPANVLKLVTVYAGAMGKGTAVRAIFEAAAELEARACLVIEARAPGIAPEWIPALVNPILSGSELSVACYQRSAYVSALTDNLAYPFARAFFSTDLRDPLASEFCVSGSLAADLAGRDVWETDVARFGLNVWLTLQSLLEGRRVVQVDLGYRGDGSGEPGMPADVRILHTVGTMFRFLTIHEKLWQKGAVPRHVPFLGERSASPYVPSRDCVPALIAALDHGRKHYQSEWRRILRSATLAGVMALLDQPEASFDFAPELWAMVVAEFAVTYNKGEGDPDKVVETFLPLFYGRTAAYVRQTEGLSPLQREAVVEEVSRAFLRSKPFFLELWNRYQPWTDAATK